MNLVIKIDPNKIPRVKKIHELKAHFFIWDAHFFETIFKVVAAKTDEKIIDEPTYPKYKIGGWIAKAGSCNIGLSPSPSVGIGWI